MNQVNLWVFPLASHLPTWHKACDKICQTWRYRLCPDTSDIYCLSSLTVHPHGHSLIAPASSFRSLAPSIWQGSDKLHINSPWSPGDWISPFSETLHSLKIACHGCFQTKQSKCIYWSRDWFSDKLAGWIKHNIKVIWNTHCHVVLGSHKINWNNSIQSKTIFFFFL